MKLVTVALLVMASFSSLTEARGCKELWTRYYNSMKPEINLQGSLDVAEDSDKDTVQIVLIKGLSEEEGDVSNNGQVIFAPYEVMTDKGKGPAYLQRLLSKSLVRRILDAESLKCPEPEGEETE